MIICKDDMGVPVSSVLIHVSRKTRRRDRRLRRIATALSVPVVFSMSALSIGIVEYAPAQEHPIESMQVVSGSASGEAEYREHSERLMERDAIQQRRMARRLERRRAAARVESPLE